MCVFKDLWEHQSTAIVSKNSTIKGTVKMYGITYVTDTHVSLPSYDVCQTTCSIGIGTEIETLSHIKKHSLLKISNLLLYLLVPCRIKGSPSSVLFCTMYWLFTNVCS
jgi:hypothetical protein